MNPFKLFGSRIMTFDGGMGTMLQKAGLESGKMPETMNFEHPEAVYKVHREYIDAGAVSVSSNSFGANLIKLSGTGLDTEKTVVRAVEIAKKAVYDSRRKVFVAANFGPTGKLFEPAGGLTFEKACESYGIAARAAEKAGADFLLFETMSDLYECKAAVIGARENSSLPIAVSVTFDETGHMLTGADAECACVYLNGLNIDAMGINCGLGPDAMEPIAKKIISLSNIPVIVSANAGLPVIENGKTVFKVGPDRFFDFARTLAACGVSAVGGCCGTTPDHIRAVNRALTGNYEAKHDNKKIQAVCSGTKACFFGGKTAVIGERLNPTGKKALKEALIKKDAEYIKLEAVSQKNAGASLLDINTGIPGENEAELLSFACRTAQSVVPLPLVLDSADRHALSKAMREYDGIPLINSVNGKEESYKDIFPLVKKYGGMVIGLLLDENGIPEEAEKRIEIAEKIKKGASEYGINEKNLMFDALTMTVATNEKNGETTLDCVKKLSETGNLTVLGVSNISYGLPDREKVNAMFLGAAVNRGLTAAIINPSSEYAKEVLKYPEEHKEFSVSECNFGTMPKNAADSSCKKEMTLFDAVVSGLDSLASELTEKELMSKKPLEVVNSELIPALDSLGDDYGSKKIFLPQLLNGAAAAKAAFSVIDGKMAGKKTESGRKVALATVKGDIHDIGKNIVCTLMSNYGFDVVDLGKDVSPQEILSAVKEQNIKLVGLSALMTTTVPSMEETVKLLRKEAPECKIMVGGAVITQEYADRMGADFYGADAVSAAKFAEKVFKDK